MLKSYFDGIIAALSAYHWVKSVEILRFDVSETDQHHILIYRLRAFLKEDQLLEIMERVVAQKKSDTFFATKYSFHWQSSNREIIKRWDNAPHHPEITSHPDHIHEGDEENVISSKRKDALEILGIINQIIENAEEG